MDEKKILELRAWAKFGKLIGGLIHNLNAPLQGLSGNSELLQMMDPDNKIAPRLLRECDRLNNILQSLGFVFEKDVNALTAEISLKSFFNQLEAFFSSNLLFKHKITKEYNIPDDCTIKTNNKVFLNALCEIYYSFIQALPQGGNFSVSITNCKSLSIKITADYNFEIADENLKYCQKWLNQINAKLYFDKKANLATYTIEF